MPVVARVSPVLSSLVASAQNWRALNRCGERKSIGWDMSGGGVWDGVCLLRMCVSLKTARGLDVFC